MQGAMKEKRSADKVALEGKNWRLSRRNFLGVAVAGLVTACGPSPSTTSPASTPVETPTPAVLTPGAPITLSNAAQIQKLAVVNANAGAVRGVAWSPDGKALAVGGWSAVQLWDAATGTRLATFPGVTDQTYQLAWSPDGQLLAAGIGDKTVRVWDARSRSLLQTLPGTDSTVFSVAWSPRGDRLAAGNSDGVVQIWERQAWHKSGAWNAPTDSGPFTGGHFRQAAYTVAWSPDGRKLAATRYDGYLRIWDSWSGKLVQLLQTSNQPNGVSWSPGGSVLASASDDGTVQLWDTARYQNVRTLAANAEGGWAFAVPWSPDGRLMACSRDGHTILVWDTQANKVLKVLDGQTESIWTAAWSPDGLRIASGSDDGTVYLWGVR